MKVAICSTAAPVVAGLLNKILPGVTSWEGGKLKSQGLKCQNYVRNRQLVVACDEAAYKA